MPDSFKQIDLTTSLVSDIAGLRSLESEWNDLLARSTSPQMFLSWEWVVSWLDAIENRIIPFVVVVRDGDGRLRGLAPLYHWRYKFLKLWVDVLQPLADHHTGIMYPGLIIDREHPVAVSRAIGAELLKRKKDYDLIWIPRMGTWHDEVLHLTEGLRDTSLTIRQRPCSYSSTQLPNNVEEYTQQLTRKVSQNLRRATRKVEQAGGEVVTCDNKADLEEFKQALYFLHDRRWTQKGELGLFERRPLAKRFYEEFLPRAAALDWLRIKAIRADDSFKAIKLGYAYDKSLLSVQAGFDPEYISGAANVLLFDVICGAIDEGLEVYDFLCPHTKHKGQWNAKERFGADLYIASNSLISRAIAKAGVWPNGRYLQPIKIPT